MKRRQAAGDAIVQQIENEIAALDLDAKLVEARIIELEAEGYRIIDGGQISGGGDEEIEWEYTDWRTGEVIATGRGTDDSCCPDNWYHMDPLRDEIFEITKHATQVKGLPDSLITALHDWVPEHEEEARVLVALNA
jgi:hypothetical protein